MNNDLVTIATVDIRVSWKGMVDGRGHLWRLRLLNWWLWLGNLIFPLTLISYDERYEEDA
jgi:hypothetical protein